ncbi:hypothetical protein PUN28_005469 [Cardiocondyla obscurior]|uniref:Uncharacterized protein n=1 Tax=Cardiocondyla obscurior TaxID=286306 RepID=A0AAW2GI30_9HYME
MPQLFRGNYYGNFGAVDSEPRSMTKFQSRGCYSDCNYLPQIDFRATDELQKIIFRYHDVLPENYMIPTFFNATGSSTENRQPHLIKKALNLCSYLRQPF